MGNPTKEDHMSSLKPVKLRQILASGTPAIGTCAYSFSPDIVQLAGYCGMDFCRIDNEHAWRQDSALENMIRASHVSDIAVVTRVDRDNPYLIRKALELGSHAVLVPQIENQHEVDDVVRAAKFPPIGTRGFGNLNQSGLYGTVDAREWIEWSNTEPLIGVMIETKAALDEVDSIFSRPGLDYVLIGAADLSINLGLPKPEPKNPAIQKAVARIVGSARKHGKWTMIGVGAPWVENAEHYLELGVDMIEIGHDFTILKQIWSESAGKLKNRK